MNFDAKVALFVYQQKGNSYIGRVPSKQKIVMSIIIYIK
jgi:hypothetical protein